MEEDEDGGDRRDESEEWMGPGQCRSELLAAHPSTGAELPAGQRDAGAARGSETFPPHPETGRSRNPTGNFAPMEPLTWPWCRVLHQCQLHPFCVPAPSPCPGGKAERGSHRKAEQTQWGCTCLGRSRWDALAPFDPHQWSPILLLLQGSGFGWDLGLGSVPPSWGRRCSLQAPGPSWSSLECPWAEPLPPPALFAQWLRVNLCLGQG